MAVCRQNLPLVLSLAAAHSLRRLPCYFQSSVFFWTRLVPPRTKLRGVYTVQRTGIPVTDMDSQAHLLTFRKGNHCFNKCGEGVFVLFNDVATNYIVSKDWVIDNNELEEIWKEAILT
jgi:hypothetical protein